MLSVFKEFYNMQKTLCSSPSSSKLNFQQNTQMDKKTFPCKYRLHGFWTSFQFQLDFAMTNTKALIEII